MEERRQGQGIQRGWFWGTGQRHIQAGLGVVVVLRGGIGKAGS